MFLLAWKRNSYYTYLCGCDVNGTQIPDWICRSHIPVLLAMAKKAQPENSGYVYSAVEIAGSMIYVCRFSGDSAPSGLGVGTVLSTGDEQYHLGGGRLLRPHDRHRICVLFPATTTLKMKSLAVVREGDVVSHIERENWVAVKDGKVGLDFLKTSSRVVGRERDHHAF